VSNHRRFLLSPLWFLVALAAMLGLNVSSAAAGGGLETRVRAFEHVTVDSVGQPSSERPASVGCLRPVQPGFVSGSCVATNTADDVLRFGAKDSWGNPNTLDDHFARHGADFGATSVDDYARQASEFLQQPGTLTKIDADGVIRVYDPAANAFGAYNANGTTRTFFTPKRGMDYWIDQPGVAP